MLKDLMHAIFKEDVEEDIEEVEDEQGNEEEATHEQVHFEETVSRPAAEPVSEIPQPVFTMPTPTPVSQPATGENAVDESIFEGLDVDTISSKPKRKNESYHFDRSKLNRKRKVVEEVEYQSVISPIFGNMEDSQKEFDKVHDAVQLPKPETDTSMIEIISPMYGNNIPEPAPVASIPTYQEASSAAKPKLDLDDMFDQKEPEKEEDKK